MKTQAQLTWGAVVVGLVLILTGCGSSTDITAQGEAVPGLESLDRFMIDFIARWDGVGGSLAVVKDGRLVFARGYGLADIEAQQPVQPDSLFRIGSVSKVVTAVSILKLVEDGRLELDARAVTILQRFLPPSGQVADPRLTRITVRQLLTHTAGWDAAQSGDPTLDGFGHTIASALGVADPPTAHDTVRYLFTRPLDFEPGARYAYSSAGYVMLGRIIEEVSRRPYEAFVRESVLAPMGITRMRLGKTRLSQRAPGEVRYYDFPGTALVRSVFPEDRGLVPHAYGGLYLEANDSCGGWLATPADLVRFASSLDGLRPPAFLTPRMIDLMVARPPNAFAPGSLWWPGLGWVVLNRPGGLDWNHNGSVWNDMTSLNRRADGVCWAASFNRHGLPDTEFLPDLQNGIDGALAQIAAWPEHDLSPALFPGGR